MLPFRVGEMSLTSAGKQITFCGRPTVYQVRTLDETFRLIFYICSVVTVKTIVPFNAKQKLGNCLMNYNDIFKLHTNKLYKF